MSDQGGWWAHETAIVDAGATIGEGTKVWHFTHVMGGTRIGRACSLGQNVFIANRTSLGDNVKVQNNVSIYEGVQLADDVFCGPSMVFTNVVNPRSHVTRKHEYRDTPVGRGASFGANCTVICGNSVGRFAFIAAGAVITTDIPAYALVMGVPGRVVGFMCQCGVRLPLAPGEPAREAVACGSCGDTFAWDGAALTETASGSSA